MKANFLVSGLLVLASLILCSPADSAQRQFNPMDPGRLPEKAVSDVFQMGERKSRVILKGKNTYFEQIMADRLAELLDERFRLEMGPVADTKRKRDFNYITFGAPKTSPLVKKIIRDGEIKPEAWADLGPEGFYIAFAEHKDSKGLAIISEGREGAVRGGYFFLQEVKAGMLGAVLRTINKRITPTFRKRFMRSDMETDDFQKYPFDWAGMFQYNCLILPMDAAERNKSKAKALGRAYLMDIYIEIDCSDANKAWPVVEKAVDMKIQGLVLRFDGAPATETGDKLGSIHKTFLDRVAGLAGSDIDVTFLSPYWSERTTFARDGLIGRAAYFEALGASKAVRKMGVWTGNFRPDRLEYLGDFGFARLLWWYYGGLPIHCPDLSLYARSSVPQTGPGAIGEGFPRLFWGWHIGDPCAAQTVWWDFEAKEYRPLKPDPDTMIRLRLADKVFDGAVFGRSSELEPFHAGVFGIYLMDPAGFNEADARITTEKAMFGSQSDRQILKWTEAFNSAVNDLRWHKPPAIERKFTKRRARKLKTALNALKTVISIEPGFLISSIQKKICGSMADTVKVVKRWARLQGSLAMFRSGTTVTVDGDAKEWAETYAAHFESADLKTDEIGKWSGLWDREQEKLYFLLQWPVEGVDHPSVKVGVNPLNDAGAEAHLPPEDVGWEFGPLDPGAEVPVKWLSGMNRGPVQVACGRAEGKWSLEIGFPVSVLGYKENLAPGQYLRVGIAVLDNDGERIYINGDGFSREGRVFPRLFRLARIVE